MGARKSKPQTKLFYGGASVSEQRRGGFLNSRIFDKVGSSGLINILLVIQKAAKIAAFWMTCF